MLFCVYTSHTHTEQVSAAVTFCTCVRKVSGSYFFRSSGCSNRFLGGFSSAPDECWGCILGHDPLPFAPPLYSPVICREMLTALWNEPPIFLIPQYECVRIVEEDSSHSSAWSAWGWVVPEVATWHLPPPIPTSFRIYHSQYPRHWKQYIWIVIENFGYILMPTYILDVCEGTVHTSQRTLCFP